MVENGLEGHGWCFFEFGERIENGWVDIRRGFLGMRKGILRARRFVPLFTFARSFE